MMSENIVQTIHETLDAIKDRNGLSYLNQGRLESVLIEAAKEIQSLWDEDNMTVTVLEHTQKHDLICSVKGQNNKIRVDPFVGCVIETDDSNFMQVGDALVGKTFLMSGLTIHMSINHPACYLPDEFSELVEEISKPVTNPNARRVDE